MLNLHIQEIRICVDFSFGKPSKHFSQLKDRKPLRNFYSQTNDIYSFGI